MEAGLGSDIRFAEDRLAGVSKFVTKLWNIARFISMFPVPKKIEFTRLTPVDQWMLSEINQVIEKILPDCDILDFHSPSIELRGFTWNLFADHIIELLKGRCFNSEMKFTRDEQESGWFALHETLKVLLKALAPITPFITDKIYREIYDEKGIHLELYPAPQKEWKSELTKHTNLLLRTNSGFWKFKRENGLSLRQGLPEAWISPELRPWAKDLQAMHGIETLNFGDPKDEAVEEVLLPESEDVIHIRSPASDSE